MIRGVLFDYGGVVADGGRGIDVAKRLRELLELPESTVHEVFVPLFQKFTRGAISDMAFWQAVEAQTKLTVTESQRHAWDTWWGFQLYPEMLELIKKLQSANYQVGLLSNVFPPTKAKIAAGGGYDPFDFVILSCDVGYAKPDPEMYQLAMDKFTALQPGEIVFIDDQTKCMPPAEELGMQTILATSTEQVIADLQKLGLSV